MLLLDGEANYSEVVMDKELVEELKRVFCEYKLAVEEADETSQQTSLTLDRKATTQRSDSGVFHAFCSGAVCEFCVGRTQTCGMPTQSLALRLDCLLKPVELGFIAGAPPEERLCRKALGWSVYVSRGSVWA